MLLGALKERIRSAQLEALRSVNREQISLYTDIGRMIVERQQRNTWGKGIVDNLAGDLRKEFPGANGFSAANPWRMKSFYEAYGGDEKLAQLVRAIGWFHNISILEKVQERAGARVLHPQFAVSMAGVEASWFIRLRTRRFRER